MLGLQRLFNGGDLTPHGFCLLWRPELLWLQVGPDALIGLSYYSIPLALAYFVWKRRDVAFGWIFWMFAAFILGCGTTHFVEIWTLWRPDYAAQGLVKVATAAISVATAIVLWPLLPQALALPSASELRQANAALSKEIEERNRVVEALQHEMVEHHRTGETLRQSQKMEGLGQLTGGIVHDFSNLLLILQGQLHILRRRSLIAGSEAQIAAMERAVARGDALARRFLSFARRQILLPDLIELREEMPKLVDLLRRSLRGNIEIRLDVAPTVGRVEVDWNEFELALINIAANARDAMPRGGIVTINVTEETVRGDDPALQGLTGQVARISISDNGTGVPTELIDRIFEPFFTTKEAGKGTGLGLSQVCSFAKRAGGAVTAVSSPGRGTTITLYLPLSTAMPLSTAPCFRDGSNDAARGTILLVDDNADVADVKAMILREYGYQVKLATDAEQALSMVSDGEPTDIVVSDIVMPGKLNGVDLARVLRKRFPELPVLLTTGYSAEAGHASQEGFTILPKPYRPEVLYRVIRDLLRPPAPAG